jgi:hypothetical protein
MLALALATVLLASAIATGCSSAGDFGLFFIHTARMYGAHPKTETALPKVRARWTSSKGSEHGFDTCVRGTSFQAVDRLMQEAFSPPDPSVQTTSDGRLRHIWHGPDIGVIIQLIDSGNHLQVSCSGERKGWAR